MAINFAAANMAGYNNPQIEIVTLAMNKEGGFTNPPTYETLDKIMRRGAFPLLSMTDPTGASSFVLALSYYNSAPDFMTFSCITQPSKADSNTATFIFVKFKSGEALPSVKRIAFNLSQ